MDHKILKTHGNEIESFIENFHDLRQNVLYMLSFEKLISSEQQTHKTLVTWWDYENRCPRSKLVENNSESDN